MAYMSNGGGPYPNKSGEYCGNHFLGVPSVQQPNKSAADAGRHQKRYLEGVDFKKPAACSGATSEELTARGWVGLYLKTDRNLFSWEFPIESDELTEAVVSAHGSSKPKRKKRHG